MERKENHLRKSIFGFVADVDMEPCLQWLPSGNVPELSYHNDASASLIIIVLAGQLAGATSEILHSLLFTGDYLLVTGEPLETRQPVLSPLAPLAWLLFEAPGWEMR